MKCPYITFIISLFLTCSTLLGQSNDNINNFVIIENAGSPEANTVYMPTSNGDSYYSCFTCNGDPVLSTSMQLIMTLGPGGSTIWQIINPSNVVLYENPNPTPNPPETGWIAVNGQVGSPNLSGNVSTVSNLSSTIPTLNEWGIIIMILMLVITTTTWLRTSTNYSTF